MSADGRIVFAAGGVYRVIGRAPISAASKAPTAIELHRDAQESGGRASQTADGSRIVFERSLADSREIWLKSPDDGREQIIARVKEKTLLNATVSPDGSRVIYTAGRGGYVVDTLVHRQICSDCQPHAFLADNRRALIIGSPPGSDVIRVADTVTGAMTTVLQIKGVELNRPDASPDDRLLAFRRQVDSGGKVFVTRLRFDRPATLDDAIMIDRADARRPALWRSVDSRTLYLLLDTGNGWRCLWGQAIDAEGRPAGAAFPARHFHGFNDSSFGTFGNAITPGGFLFEAARRIANLWILQDAGSTQAAPRPYTFRIRTKFESSRSSSRLARTSTSVAAAGSWPLPRSRAVRRSSTVWPSASSASTIDVTPHQRHSRRAQSSESVTAKIGAAGRRAESRRAVRPSRVSTMNAVHEPARRQRHRGIAERRIVVGSLDVRHRQDPWRRNRFRIADDRVEHFDGANRMLADRGLARQHDRVGAGVDCARGIGDFGARRPRLRAHRFEHLRRHDHRHAAAAGDPQHLLLHLRHVLERHLESEIAARHHHGIGDASMMSARQPTASGRSSLATIGTPGWPHSAAMARARANPPWSARSSARPDRRRAARPNRRSALVLGRDADRRQRHVRRVDALVLAERPAVDHARQNRRRRACSTTSSILPSSSSRRSPGLTAAASGA